MGTLIAQFTRWIAETCARRKLDALGVDYRVLFEYHSADGQGLFTISVKSRPNRWLNTDSRGDLREVIEEAIVLIEGERNA